jgi:hypothetical protein
MGCNTQVHGNNTRNLSVYLSLSQSSKTTMFFLLSLMFSVQQNWRTRGQNRFCPEVGWRRYGGGRVQIMCTRVSKCKKDKIKFKK